MKSEDFKGIAELLEHASEADAEAHRTKLREEDARTSATVARHNATEAWNLVYNKLMELSKLDTQAFRESKLGELLKAQAKR